MGRRPKTDPEAAAITSDDIDAQVQAYLDQGGTIQQIPSGVSGFDIDKPNKHIVINSNYVPFERRKV